MGAWVLEALNAENRANAAQIVGRDLLASVTGARPEKTANFRFTQNSCALAVSMLLGEGSDPVELRATAEQAFETSRAASDPANDTDGAKHRLITACYGVLADRTPDVARYLRAMPVAPVSAALGWGGQVDATITRVWLLLLRKQGWADLDAVQAEVEALRQQQAEAEAGFLDTAGNPRGEAWALVALYHLAKAAELLATFSAQGSVGFAYDIREQLEAQFDRCILACERAELIDMHALARLLAATAEKLVANSIWTVTRAVNSRVTRFVANLAGRDHPTPIFEMLPPQRITLREHGLLGSGHRAVVVSLPTSSGKTFIAQFRMLQALNQFDADRGWIAYVAPTRALVNQICSRLRRDFTPLGIVVERISPALEIDGIEAELLTTTDDASAFRILVGTPEKIDLLLRGGWESKIGRPLTLVVIDEAHNLADKERGLTLELLLATINRECRQSQFLLLTPFISNSGEIAKWLSPDSHADISIGFDWRPNDRAVMLARPERTEVKGDFRLTLETLHTSRATIEIDEELLIAEGRPLGLRWSDVSGSQSNVAVAAAEILRKRGPVIVLAGTVPNSWSMARTLARKPATPDQVADPDLAFVRDFVASEYGEAFALTGLLEKGIGLHHSGLSEETRVLTEWLVERGKIETLVATTTIAQGVNFPVTGVVMAAHQYPYGVDMPPEDFWNLAGRAGRADQAGTGIIALAACTDGKADVLRGYVQRQVKELNSTLLEMVQTVLAEGEPLELHRLYWKKEWSAFLQYLAHSYRQIGDHAIFAAQVEQVLRGSLGFQKLRQQSLADAGHLVAAVQDYAAVLNGKPLSLVDATGFSWESVSLALANVGEAGIRAESWRPDTLFRDGDSTLERAFGVLFKVPEIRQELVEVTGGGRGDGKILARIVKDWVQGADLPYIAKTYFQRDGDDLDDAITRACRAVHGRLALSASWGVSALQALTSSEAVKEMDDEELRAFQNLPSRIFYGVDTDDAIDLRLLGVPRSAAPKLVELLRAGAPDKSIKARRAALNALSEGDWTRAVGSSGPVYRRAWRVLEGFE